MDLDEFRLDDELDDELDGELDDELDDDLDDELDGELDDELDDSWLTNYSVEEEIFNKFYKDTVKNIKLYFFYIDSKREIIKVLKQKKDISNNVLLKDEISKIVNKNRCILNKKFILSQIVKYNFNIENSNINKFINDNEFLTKINEITDIYWDNTIPFFSSLNSLYFIFYEKRNKNTKKIFLKRKKKSKTKKLKIKELQIRKSDIIKID